MASPLDCNTITYTTRALTPVIFFLVPNTIPSHPDSRGSPSATPSMMIRPRHEPYDMLSSLPSSTQTSQNSSLLTRIFAASLG
eukprot:1146942-Pelagomonas_calceolata.AAC.3